MVFSRLPINRPSPVVMKASGSHSFHIENVHCIDETGGNWFSERGDDDIYLGGVSISLRGATKIPYFKVGGFSDGDKKTYNPSREIASFNQGGASAVILVLVERDSGDQMEGFLNDLVQKNQALLTKTIHQFNGNTDPLGDESSLEDEIWATLIKEGLKLAKDLLISWYKSARKDDIFEPQMVSYSSSNAIQKVRFKGHDATYDIAYRWL